METPTDDSYSSDFAEKSELKPLYSDYARNTDGLDLFGLEQKPHRIEAPTDITDFHRSRPVRSGISQISADFADNLQNSFIFSWWFRRKSVILAAESFKRLNFKIMAATALNSTQVHLLQMFQVDDSQNGLEELKELLYSYYSKKMDESLNKLWDSGVLDQKRLDEINVMDLHKLKMS